MEYRVNCGSSRAGIATMYAAGHDEVSVVSACGDEVLAAVTEDGEKFEVKTTGFEPHGAPIARKLEPGWEPRNTLFSSIVRPFVVQSRSFDT